MLEQEHGRLVARLRRQIGKVEKHGLDDGRGERLLSTVRSLIVCERLQALDPLDAAAVKQDSERMAELGRITKEELLARVALMAPGAGLVLGSEGSK